ncbi:hypothetical protein BCL79_0626 [Stenotrophomonas rhizophila]|uniref:Portal protein n=1 Tax=Stenotrophomonas rhizophila TaxID=216778 RepID=A0A498CGW9_9GAMM|nr:hypothetical protein [Stenotrophomonas rhizophila]RLK56243.1 hypothetical protein BCL79_0626 [Stenotrophomonas rhizophila]
MTDQPIAALETGIAMAADPDPARAKKLSREQADVRRWMARFEEAREYDVDARRQYARDRRQARGDSGFLVDANLIGTYIDIQESFLYARNPDFDVTPGPAHRMPTPEQLRDVVESNEQLMAQLQQQAEDEAMEVGRRVAVELVAAGVPEDQALAQSQQAQDSFAAQGGVDKLVSIEVMKLRKQYARRSREMKQFCETMEAVGTQMWKDANLKRRGRPWVRSSLTIGPGVLKASWQERTEISPETQTAINDLQQNISRARALQTELEDGSAGVIAGAWDTVKGVFGNDQEAKIADLERQLETIQSGAERVVARGYVIDNVDGENFQVAPGFTIANHLDAPWNGELSFISYEDALAQFGPYLAQYDEKGRAEEILGKATRYYPRKPCMGKDESVSAMSEGVTAADADAYTTNSTTGATSFLRVVELWDSVSNTVLTGITGVPYWVKPGFNPPATTRFYPYFVLCTSEVDGQRHPQSLVTRSTKLMDEYNRIGSAEAEHRRRIIPKMGFNAGAMEAEEVQKLVKAKSGEYVAIKTTQPNVDLRNLLMPISYPQMDPAVYSRVGITTELERIWGIQEALSGSVNTAKTATEADIQQQGFQARSSSRRDSLESVLSDLAQYTCEISRVYLTDEDVRFIAGPSAFWPPYMGPDDLTEFVRIEIRAGSSGKPNTALERQSWANLLPLLQQGITQIGQLRGASPESMADAIEQLMRLTAERSGERIDIDQLIPQNDGSQPVQPPQPQPAAGPGGQQPPMESAPPGGDPSADPLAA